MTDVLQPQSIDDLNLPTPENQPIVIPPTPAPPTFDDAQQEYLDKTLIPKVMGRAARDVRAELAATKTRLANAEAALKAATSTDETTRLKAELQLARAEAEAVKTAAAEATKTSDIERALAKADVVDVALLRTALADRVQRVGNDYQILDEAGSVREGVSLQQFIDEEANKRPYLVRGQVKPGQGSRGSDGLGPANPSVPLNQLFGKGSSGQAANELAKRDPQRYKALKIQAQKAGLI